MDRSAIVKVSSPCDSILIATRSLYANKRLNSVDDNRLNGVKADTSLMDRPRPSNTIFDERNVYKYTVKIAAATNLQLCPL